MEPSDDPPAADATEVNRLHREAVAGARGYADFWHWPSDKRLAECGVVETLMAFLAAHEGWEPRTLAPAERDPPDVVAVLADGRRVGVEVTEIVDHDMAARHGARQTAERRGNVPSPTKAASPHETARWKASALRTALEAAIRKKDVEASGGPFDVYLVVMHTDETTITTAMANEATRPLRITARYVDAAYLVMSYHPDEVANFPGGYPVIPVPVERSRS
jgi:hypothetical protein